MCSKTKFSEAAFGLVLGIVLFAVAAIFAGCAHKADQAALGFEKALVAGSAAVDEFVDMEIERCTALDLPTVAERTKCVEKADKVSDATEKAMELAVEGLRVYWSARAKNDTSAMVHGLELVKQAAALLPGDFFAGLKGLK